MKIKRTLAGVGGAMMLAAMLAGCGSPRENGTLIGTGVGAAGGAVVGSAVGHPLAGAVVGNHEQHEYYRDGY
jgi:hypothetical protein